MGKGQQIGQREVKIGSQANKVATKIILNITCLIKDLTSCAFTVRNATLLIQTEKNYLHDPDDKP